jgi:endoglucanase
MLRYIAVLLIFLLQLRDSVSYAQPVIYSDPVSLITGTWASNGTLTETNQNGPLEGNLHYRFNYSFSSWWAGCGLNMDNWGSSAARDFSGYSYISVSYKGITGAEYLQLQLRSGSATSNNITVGYASADYQTVLIPLNNFTGVSLSAITELIFSISGVQSASGSVYLDDIKLTSSGAAPYNGQNANHTSVRTWLRYARMNKGLNLSNWLEAYWLIPYNAFPESNKYNRSNIQTLVNMGFKNIRMPVTFERVASVSAPYTIPANHEIWRLIDSAIVWANDMDFTLIICNHHGYDITNSNYTAELPRKQAIWQQVLNRYANLDPDRYFFELFNEPTNEINNVNLRQFYLSLLPSVRPQVPNHTLILGGNHWNSKSGLTGLVTLQDPDIIYTYHDYDPYPFTHAGMSWTSPPYMPVLTFPRAGHPNDATDLTNSIAAVRIWADTSGVPVMCGEFGVTTAAAAQDRCQWIHSMSAACQANGIPWYYWDAISNSDAFGFINLSNSTIIPCFADTLNLGAYNICNLTVTNTADYGVGSLRNALMCAKDGDTIYFHPSLAGDTILLHSYAIPLVKNVTLLNTNTQPVFIQTMYNFPNVSVLQGKQAKLENIHLNTLTDKSLSGFGQLTLKNVHIITGSNTLTTESPLILHIENNVLIKN